MHAVNMGIADDSGGDAIVGEGDIGDFSVVYLHHSMKRVYLFPDVFCWRQCVVVRVAIIVCQPFPVG